MSQQFIPFPVRLPGQLRGSPERGITVEEFARDLMEAGGVPTEYREDFLPYLLPALDPAKNPDYAAIIVRAGQPCTRTAIVGNFKALQDRIDYVVDNMDNEDDAKEAKKSLLESLFRGQVMTLAEPLEEGPLKVNLEFDENGNAVGVQPSDLGRMYPCNRYLETKYPEAHAEVEERRLKQATEAAANVYRTNPTRMLAAADEQIAELTEGTRELASVLERADAEHRQDISQFIGSVYARLFAAKYTLRAIDLAKAAVTETSSIEAKRTALKQMIDYAEELKARADAFVEGTAEKAEVPAPPASPITRPLARPAQFLYPDATTPEKYRQAVLNWKYASPKPVATSPEPLTFERINAFGEEKTVTTDAILPTDSVYKDVITEQAKRLRRGGQTRKRKQVAGRRKTRRNRQ